MNEDAYIDKVELMHEQLVDCLCKGNSANPWDYCDDCLEARDFLDKAYNFDVEWQTI